MFTPTLSPIQLMNYQPYAASVEARFVNSAYTTGLSHLSSTITSETFESRFNRLTDAWKDATRFYSTYNHLLSNSAYLEIISMGKDALPFIFESMKKEEAHWFIALHILTNVNPVPVEHRGNIHEMTKSWLAWAKTKGYVA